MNDNLPEEKVKVLCLTTGGLVQMGYVWDRCEKDTWVYDAKGMLFSEDGWTVTHWAYINLPKTTQADETI